MPINFPNASRSYDATRRRVRFWGHDSALEIAFFIDADALIAGQPGAEGGPSRGSTPDTASPDANQAERAEAAVLLAFDEGLDRIHEVAASVYARGRGYTHVLTAADF